MRLKMPVGSERNTAKIAQKWLLASLNELYTYVNADMGLQVTAIWE